MNKLGIVLCALMALAAADVAPELKTKMKQYAKECNEESKLEPERIKIILSLKELPANENEKCFLTCNMKKLGILGADNKIDFERTSTLNKLKYNSETALKADEVVKICQKKVTSTAGGCETGLEVLKCMKQEAKQLGVSASNYS